MNGSMAYDFQTVRLPLTATARQSWVRYFAISDPGAPTDVSSEAEVQDAFAGVRPAIFHIEFNLACPPLQAVKVTYFIHSNDPFLAPDDVAASGTPLPGAGE